MARVRTTEELTCRELVELVTEYLEGTLSRPERSRFEEHLAECPGCRAYLEQMRQTIAAAGHLPVEALSAPARAVLLEAFRHWRPAT